MISIMDHFFEILIYKLKIQRYYKHEQQNKGALKMKKYDSIKKINLMHRQSVYQPQTRRPLWRFQSSSRSSHKNINRDQCQNMECLTDRLRPTKINQFTISTPTPTPDSLNPNNQLDYSLQSPQSCQPLITFPNVPCVPLSSTSISNSTSMPVSYKTSNIQTYIRFKPFTKNQLLSLNCDPSSTQVNTIGINVIDERSITVQQPQNNNNNNMSNNYNNNYNAYQSQQSQASSLNKLYTFDKIFGPDTSQKYVYESTSKQLVKSFINGYNGTIFAYGQTGSGKTYTMFGDINTNSDNCEDQTSNNNSNMGIIPLTIDQIFTSLDSLRQEYKKITLSCSMCQIYKQVICDLMQNSNNNNPLQSIQNNVQKEIKIKDNQAGSIQIQNLTIKQITNKSQLLDWIAKSMELRKVRETQVNQRSSRSHYILTLYLNVQISDAQTRVSKLNLVDLAGSQKISKTKVSGQGLQQAIKINLSLSCLGNAIYALSRGQEHVPFRDSKLTRILQQSLSGNSLTRVIVTCSLSANCKQETLSSLQFANRIKKIKTSSSLNVKQISESGHGQSVNKLMYQTLKNSYQNCEEKLQKIKYFIQNCSMRATKQEIIQCIKNIVVLKQGNDEQNQFLGMGSCSKQLQTFRSPYKQKQQTIITDSYQNDERGYDQNQFINNSTITKQNTKLSTQSNIELNKHINNLETILIKQEKIIQKQSTEIQVLKKQLLSCHNNNKNVQTDRQQYQNSQQEKKNGQKLKILKSSNNNNGNNNVISSIASKLKQVKSKNKHGEQQSSNNNKFDNKVSPFVTKFQHRSHSHKKQDIKTNTYNNAQIENADPLLTHLSQQNHQRASHKQVTKQSQVQINFKHSINNNSNTVNTNGNNNVNNNRREYTNMQKQILDKQVRALAKHIQQLNRVIIDNGLQHKVNKYAHIDNFKIENQHHQCTTAYPGQLSMGAEQQNLYKKLKQKDQYIAQLLQLLELSNCHKAQINNINKDNKDNKNYSKSKKQSIKQSVESSTKSQNYNHIAHHINNSINNNRNNSNSNQIRNLSSMASPATSCSISRVNSAQLITKI